ncbi:MAG: Hpt domain-containing protein, partial [Victivallales bacterium]|nr:Hpt domain-containing protein [Victivallales bacterium]
MEDQELIESFISESSELIDDVEPLFIQMEKKADCNEPVDIDTVNKIFRLFHSMKGSAAFLNLENIAQLTHHAETLLDQFRKNPELRMTSYYLETQLQAIDAIRAMLELVSATGSDAGTEEMKDETVKQLVEAYRRVQGEGNRDHESPDAPAATGPDDTLKALLLAERDGNFLLDGGELLGQVEDVLLRLGKTEDVAARNELAAEAGRLLHGFTGMCGILRLADLARVSYAAECIVDAMSGGRAELNAQNVEILLQAIDALIGGVKSLAGDERPGEIQN